MRTSTNNRHLPVGISAAARVATATAPYRPIGVFPTWNMLATYGAAAQAVQAAAHSAPSSQVAQEANNRNHATTSMHSHVGTNSAAGSTTAAVPHAPTDVFPT